MTYKVNRCHYRIHTEQCKTQMCNVWSNNLGKCYVTSSCGCSLPGNTEWIIRDQNCKFLAYTTHTKFHQNPLSGLQYGWINIVLSTCLLMLQTLYHEAAEQMLDSLLEQCCSVKAEVASLQKTNTIATQGGFSVLHHNFQITKQICRVSGVQRIYHWNTCCIAIIQILNLWWDFVLFQFKRTLRRFFTARY
jgi:hypothetical protein